MAGFEALPPELVHLILRSAAKPLKGSPLHPDSAEARLEANHELSSYALVCHFLRDIAQQELFARPFCKSPDATNAFLDAVTDRPNLSDAVWEISGPWDGEYSGAVMEQCSDIRTVKLIGATDNSLLEMLPPSIEILSMHYCQPMAEQAPFTQLCPPLPRLSHLAALRTLSISGTVGPTWIHLISSSPSLSTLHLLPLYIPPPHVPLFLAAFAARAPYLRTLLITPFDPSDPLPRLPWELLGGLNTLGIASSALLLPPANEISPLAQLPPTGELTCLAALNNVNLKSRSYSSSSGTGSGLRGGGGTKRLSGVGDDFVEMLRSWPVARALKLVVLGDRLLAEAVTERLEKVGVHVRIGGFSWEEGVIEYE